jgi:hypothetical protein
VCPLTTVADIKRSQDFYELGNNFRLYQQGNSVDKISVMTGLDREFIEKTVQNQKLLTV